MDFITVFWALGAVLLYRLGLGDGQRMAQGGGIVPRPGEEKASRWDKILDNINRYNGTNRGQREVE